MKSFVRAVDGLNRLCGAFAAVLVVALIVLMLYDVGMRYIFNAPTAWGFDINTWLMGAAFILSVGYALSFDSHVRVDLLYTERTTLVEPTWELLLKLPVDQKLQDP